MFDWICICQTLFSFLDKNHLEWVWVVIRAVSKPGFLWNQINHGSHNIFWLFRLKALQKVRKIKNPCRFLQSFWKNPLVKWPFSSARWSGILEFHFFQNFHFQTNFFFLQKITFTLEMSFWDLLYWCRSKIKKVRGGLKSYNWSLWGPL